MSIAIGWMGDFWDPRNPEGIPHSTVAMLAHSLGNLCRFNGQCKSFYSVAQHSIMVSRLVVSCPLEGLFHDSHEVYTGDMIDPQKEYMEGNAEMEQRFARVIWSQHGLNFERFHSAEIARANKLAMYIEIAQLFPRGESYVLDRSGEILQYTHWVEPMGPVDAAEAFIDRYTEIIESKHDTIRT